MTTEEFQQVMTLITVVGTGVGTVLVQIYRESRQRAWAEKDRAFHQAEDAQHREDLAERVRLETAAVADKVKLQAELLANKVRADAEVISIQLKNDRERLEIELARQALLSKESRTEVKHAIEDASRKVDQTIERADAAYKEANHVNLKIEDLNKRLIDQGQVAEKKQAEARTIGESTLKGVQDMAEHGTKVARDTYQGLKDLANRGSQVDRETKDTAVAIQKTTDEINAKVPKPAQIDKMQSTGEESNVMLHDRVKEEQRSTQPKLTSIQTTGEDSNAILKTTKPVDKKAAPSKPVVKK